MTTMSFSLLAFFAGCTSVPPTVENDPSLEFVELQGYRFHIQTYGDKAYNIALESLRPKMAQLILFLRYRSVKRCASY